MLVETEEINRRKVVELCLKECRRRLSSQTGYIHYCYEAHEEEVHHTIPVLENFTYALALFRTKTAENISEAKELITKLFVFEVNGNFPVYLHEFPTTRDPNLSAHLLPVFYHLFQEYHQVLGEEFTALLNKKIAKILKYLTKCADEKMLSKPAEAKFRAYTSQLEQFDFIPKSPKEWADYIVSLQMQPSLSDLYERYEQVAKCWHKYMCSYVGVFHQFHQDKNEPLVTLYDLFMGQFYQHFSSRSVQSHPVQMQASLVYDAPFQLPIIHPEKKYITRFQPDERLSFIMFWGSEKHTHSLVCDRKKCRINIKNEHYVELIFALPDEVPYIEDALTELAFYLNINESNKIFINGQKATTFALGDHVEIQSSGLSITLVFSSLEEDNRFMGHLALSNRPGQLALKGSNVYEAYDWRISLRTLERTPLSHIKVKMLIKEI